jgi:peptidylprolyl isomerase
VLLAVPLALGLTACGGDEKKPTPTPVATSKCPNGPATADLAKKPTVTLPAGSTAPAATTSTDVVVGTGDTAKVGSPVQVKYLGVLFDTCEEFDSSWSRGSKDTLSFTVGGGVIPGFSTGVEGMRVGGRRQVVIPAKDGYGDQGTGPIPPGATLVFVLDLVKVG